MELGSSRPILIPSVMLLASVVAGCKPDNGPPAVLGNIGNLTVSAAYSPPGITAAGQQCPLNTSGVVSFTVAPQALTSADGLTTQQGKTKPLSDLSSVVWKDIENGSPSYGCSASVDFLNLASGTWKVTVAGAGPRTDCTVTITKQGETKLKVWSGNCLVGDLP